VISIIIQQYIVLLHCIDFTLLLSIAAKR